MTVSWNLPRQPHNKIKLSARAAMMHGHGDTSGEGEIAQRVELRLARQRQLARRPDTPTLWAVVEETALRCPVAQPQVMRAQIEALAQGQPHLRLQIVPQSRNIGQLTAGSFTMLRFPDSDLSDIVYLEQLTSALFLSRAEDVDHYAKTLDQIYMAAEPVTRTMEILDQILTAGFARPGAGPVGRGHARL